jgi:hypothetical protein
MELQNIPGIATFQNGDWQKRKKRDDMKKDKV